jgi:Predicted membrane protein (DUF2214)
MIVAKSFFLVRAVVTEPLRDKFDRWYSTDHLPWAIQVFKCEKVWRFWSEVEQGVHYAGYQFVDKAELDAALASQEFKELVADFNRSWPDGVNRTRDVVSLAHDDALCLLHHVAACTLVSALAVELVLLRQELTLAVARRLPIVDVVLGVSAGILLVVGLLRVFYFREKRRLLFPQSRLPHKIVGLYRSCLVIDHTDCRIPVVEKGREKRTRAGCDRAKIALSSQGHSWRVGRGRHYPPVCRYHGARRMGLGDVLVAACDSPTSVSGSHKRPA